MKTIRKFTVVPSLPERLKPLMKIAKNLWWSWEPEAIKLFFRLDRDLWETTNQNPIRVLGEMDQNRLEHLAEEETFLAHLDRVEEMLDDYLSSKTWYQTHCDGNDGRVIAYYSAEFGVSDALPVYSGGLGILAGDHLKSASDLGIPLVGVGLLYRQGYFRQYLNIDGWQQERYPENDFYNMPLDLMKDENGEPITIHVNCPTEVHARIWRAQVGRIPLYLLDANLRDVNSAEDRAITAQLYGGDKDMRIRQEMLLGIGGVRALRVLSIEPNVFHINEGHAAFLTLERAQRLITEQGLSPEEAREVVKASTIFTTHTPVPAGHDVFAPEQIDKYFGKKLSELSIDRETLLRLGRKNPADKSEGFNMTMLAINLSSQCNGVSKLHGEVSREMMSSAYPDVPTDEVPISSVTNGIHTRSWLSFDLADLYDRYLGPRWVRQPGDHTIWERVDNIPDTELWRTHERRRERLVWFCRERLRKQLLSRGLPSSEVAIADEVLDPEALTIGFARRFATYKRGDLLFRDPERLAKILSDAKRPVQIVYAGKAHPADSKGKEFIRNIIHHGRKPEFRHRIVFLEDYEMNVARYIYQGVDVWLNNPRRKMEASGTSGMKAAANGALNMSIPDGWWCEGFDGKNGWNIGHGEDYKDLEYQDEVESQDMYDMLEHEVVPTFYNRGADNVPREWIAMMKDAIRTICPMFNTNRMVQEYTQKFYISAAERYAGFCCDNGKRAKEISQWKNHVRQHWGEIQIRSVQSDNGNEVIVRGDLHVQAEVMLGALQPSDVSVEAYYGATDHQGSLPSGDALEMEHAADLGGGVHRFEGTIHPGETGRHGYSIRVLPKHPDMPNPFEMRLITWA